MDGVRKEKRARLTTISVIHAKVKKKERERARGEWKMQPLELRERKAESRKVIGNCKSEIEIWDDNWQFLQCSGGCGSLLVWKPELIQKFIHTVSPTISGFDICPLKIMILCPARSRTPIHFKVYHVRQMHSGVHSLPFPHIQSHTYRHRREKQLSVDIAPPRAPIPRRVKQVPMA